MEENGGENLVHLMVEDMCQDGTCLRFHRLSWNSAHDKGCHELNLETPLFCYVWPVNLATLVRVRNLFSFPYIRECWHLVPFDILHNGEHVELKLVRDLAGILNLILNCSPSTFVGYKLLQIGM